jgi:hypothetical protein
VEPVADAAEEVRRQVGPAPEQRHGGGGGWILYANGGYAICRILCIV